MRTTLSDGLWVRLVDVEAALSARTYAADPDVVLEVGDAFCPWNAGRYRLSGGRCERTDAPADLALDVDALGAAYLGGTIAARARTRRPRRRAARGCVGARVGGDARRHRPVVPGDLLTFSATPAGR